MSYQSGDGVVNGCPGGGVSADAPTEHDDLIRRKAQFVDSILHDRVDGVMLLRRVGFTLEGERNS